MSVLLKNICTMLRMFIYSVDALDYVDIYSVDTLDYVDLPNEQ
jgi:hypothetical protein